jgi:hypothetical protein
MKGMRLMALALVAAAVLGACRGDRPDLDDDDDTPPAAVGGMRDTAPGTTGATSDSLIPVPGTPHNVRPGVTDTNNHTP